MYQGYKGHKAPHRLRERHMHSANNKIINRKTGLCFHRPQTESHSYEYVNSTPKAEQALPAWRGVGRSSRDTKPAAVQQRRCAQLSYSLAVSSAVLLTRLNKKQNSFTLLLLLKLLENNERYHPPKNRALLSSCITPTFRPCTHTSDDSYIYQLSLVLATATVSSCTRYILEL